MSARRYSIYVIELSKRVFTENEKFRKANPQYNGVLECLYVGMTSKTPEQRFTEHISGHVNTKGHNLSASIAKKYGLYLRPSLYEHLGKFSKADALIKEEELALELRTKRFAVWYN